MFLSRRMAGRGVPATVLLLLASTAASASTVTVTATVTPVGDLFQYAYSISNSTPDDAFLIDIPVPNNPSAVTDLVAPAGFTTAFDSGLGLVSFLENTSFFSATPQSGFSFESPEAPVSAIFEATLVSSSTGALYTLSGMTTAPVPEPSFVLPGALLGIVLFVFSRFRRKSTPIAIE